MTGDAASLITGELRLDTLPFVVRLDDVTIDGWAVIDGMEALDRLDARPQHVGAESEHTTAIDDRQTVEDRT